MIRPATVYLVGAGPGDPGLLTCRGDELLRTADAVVYDRLAHPALLARTRPDARKVYVGKIPGKEQTPQEEIHRILAELAGEGLSVVRLKGGDPFVFGRGGEEALYLLERGIAFEVVPGVTAGIAVPAYAGIPVTHRAVAVGVSFFTGHEEPGKEESQLHLEGLARPGTTGVFYMGRRNLGRLVGELLRLGRAPETPAAIVSWGTRPEQRTVVATLSTLEAKAAEAGLEPPCITVIGEVVALREQLAWYERRPLSGTTVAVTRARAQASELADRLRDLGAAVLETPAIRIEAPEDPEPLRQAARRVGEYRWVIFTSTNGVERFFQELRAAGRDTRALGTAQVAAIGPGTAARLASEGVVADLVPERFQAEGVLKALEGRVAPGDRVLLPRAREARDVLPKGLADRGVEVEVVEAYRTVPEPPEPEVEAAFAEGRVDLVTFASSSTVRNFDAALGRHPRNYRVACIGPITAGTARELGYRVDLEAAASSLDGLVEALVRDPARRA